MVLKFKKRGVDDLKKVMVYGNDGTGKSTFAEQYCKDNNLNPVCIDVDDTNYTNVPILDLDLGTDIKTFKNIKSAITEIGNSPDIDTIIIDGVTSLLEMLVSTAKGLKKYSDRAERFQALLRALNSSKKHLIFIGQADMEVIFNEEVQSSKMVIKVNSIVNEKYKCYKTKEGYSHKVVKYRTFESEYVTAVDEPEEKSDKVEDDVKKEDPIHGICILIKEKLEKEGVNVNKSSMKSKLIKMIKSNEISAELRPQLIQYIQKHCPEEL